MPPGGCQPRAILASSRRALRAMAASRDATWIARNRARVATLTRRKVREMRLLVARGSACLQGLAARPSTRSTDPTGIRRRSPPFPAAHSPAAPLISSPNTTSWADRRDTVQNGRSNASLSTCQIQNIRPKQALCRLLAGCIGRRFEDCGTDVRWYPATLGIHVDAA